MPSLACTECPYIFTEAEIAAENKNAWGHPCHGVKDEPGTVCESFRKPMYDETRKLIQKLVDALRHARPHVYASSVLDGEGVATAIAEIDVALIEADEVIHWSDNA